MHWWLYWKAVPDVTLPRYSPYACPWSEPFQVIVRLSDPKRRPLASLGIADVPRAFGAQSVALGTLSPSASVSHASPSPSPSMSLWLVLGTAGQLSTLWQMP